MTTCIILGLGVDKDNDFMPRWMWHSLNNMLQKAMLGLQEKLNDILREQDWICS
jgi:hypothetical protein